ncbi:hypothetical protein PPL_08200 [Heterostelium album PN500]|uniref:F-box domain-containing protein n=1 Tax=Heterostelium pallidum (strain ATCC 26659 / Pp 5 / PN500) TaxID=670386 RepID=D3BIW5_HETP5|nr:hypothetical protein PPL_08200 [Heterostelium album PN500]EFA78739.1 hypothetical protein PPL_08200 [Heterostelium album PN500]|eukprot:XP_020430863.1 hypothetical protein PPL_08200 [Heterostelium album PN500]
MSQPSFKRGTPVMDSAYRPFNNNFKHIPQQSQEFPHSAPVTPKFHYSKESVSNFKTLTQSPSIASSSNTITITSPYSSNSNNNNNNNMIIHRNRVNTSNNLHKNTHCESEPASFAMTPRSNYQSTPNMNYSPMDISYSPFNLSTQTPMITSPIESSLSAKQLEDLLSQFPEEILITILSFLTTSDLYSCLFVSKTWRRLCEDEYIFKSICQFNYPCLQRYIKPPFETSWKRFYRLRKGSFLVLGGPVAQSSCMDDICSKLRSVGIKRIEHFYTQKRIPTLEELQKYAGVLVYSYNSSAFMCGQAMGDVLADYVDNGGGVVVTVFTNCNNLRNGFLKGRFLEQNYHPITPSRQHDTNGKKPLTLGKVFLPEHPIMNDVKSLDGGRSSFYCPGALHPDAALVAEWSNNFPLVAELNKGKGKVVALNFFPPSSDTGDARFWSSATDGSILMGNALAYVGKSAILKKYKQSLIEGATFYNAQKDGEGASNGLHDKDMYGHKRSPKEKKHKFLGKDFNFGGEVQGLRRFSVSIN